MTILHLHNSLTRKKEPFVPLDPSNIGMYVCGPTVYDFAHLGNARSAVAFDQMRRTLLAFYPKVTFVRNVTDIDDKIIERSRETGEPMKELTARTYRAYVDDMAELGVLEPTFEPRATAHVAHMQRLIHQLLANGHAYEAEGHVLFDVRSNPRAGVLSGHDLDALRAGARVEKAPYKRDPADFVLWKPSPKGVPGWPSPWGFGRPGWHIECSAMAAEYLGEVFDIHGGGQDLIFPHHENEIAQSTCAHGTKLMARVFVHNAMLVVDGRKMAKSAGNFLTVRDLLAEFPGRGEAIRLVLLGTHYRQNLDFTRERVTQSIHALDRFYGVIRRAGADIETVEGDNTPVLESLADDINTPLAIARLHELATVASSSWADDRSRLQAAASLRASGHLLGILKLKPSEWFGDGSGDKEVEVLVQKRWEARKARDFATADSIRKSLAADGVVLEDSATGTTWRRA